MPKLLICACVAAACLVLASVPPGLAAGMSHKIISWRVLAPGLDFARVEAVRYVRLGSPRIAVLRLDPERIAFRVFHIRDTEAKRPMWIETWLEKTGALAVFNTGQYDERGVHLGLLIRDGKNIGTRVHRLYKGVFAAEPKSGAGPKAVIIDLDEQRFDPADELYTQVVQSFMLLDSKGRKRVRRSDWKANRTVLAVDTAGRILVLCTEGGYTLWEMASWLMESDLDIVRAMSLDGGYRAEMALSAAGFSYATYGQWETNDFGNLSLPGFRATLPAVVGVFRR